MIWANRTAIESGRGDGPLAYGSKIVFEVWKAKLDAEGKPVLDGQGRRIPDSLVLIAVAEKQPGFGSDRPLDLRIGEWEFAAYKPDGTFIERDYAPCYQCHVPLQASDYLFSRADLKRAKAE